MSTTPEAQRLARVLEQMPLGEVDQLAADMLRAQATEVERLTAGRDALRAALQKSLTAMEEAVHFYKTGDGRPPSQTFLFEIEEARAALAQKGE